MSDSTDTTMLVKPFTNCGSQFQPWSSHDLSTPASSSSGRKRSRSRSIEDQQVLPGMDGTGLNVSGSPWKGWAELENDPVRSSRWYLSETDSFIAHLYPTLTRLGSLKRECGWGYSLGCDLWKTSVSTVPLIGISFLPLSVVDQSWDWSFFLAGHHQRAMTMSRSLHKNYGLLTRWDQAQDSLIVWLT